MYVIPHISNRILDFFENYPTSVLALKKVRISGNQRNFSYSELHKNLKNISLSGKKPQVELLDKKKI